MKKKESKKTNHETSIGVFTLPIGGKGVVSR